MSPDGPDLPLPDYDRLSPGDLVHRIRALSAGELERLLVYEREHAARPRVLEDLSFRLRQVKAGAMPTGGGAGYIYLGEFRLGRRAGVRTPQVDLRRAAGHREPAMPARRAVTSAVSNQCG